MKLHPAFIITPAQRADVDDLRARLTAAIRQAPEWRTPRPLRMVAKLDRHLAANDSFGLKLFLADWREGIEAEIRSLELLRADEELSLSSASEGVVLGRAA